VVAVGTSLPELATSVVAALKRNTEIAVGNAVGSNIFNIFLILGITAVVEPIPVQPRANIDVGMTVAASLLLLLTAFTGGRRLIERWEGIAMVVIYICYIAGAFLFAGGY
jgi:cation:H+ antiporter